MQFKSQNILRSPKAGNPMGLITMYIFCYANKTRITRAMFGSKQIKIKLCTRAGTPGTRQNSACKPNKKNPWNVHRLVWSQEKLCFIETVCFAHAYEIKESGGTSTWKVRRYPSTLLEVNAVVVFLSLRCFFPGGGGGGIEPRKKARDNVLF